MQKESLPSEATRHPTVVRFPGLNHLTAVPTFVTLLTISYPATQEEIIDIELHSLGT
ncbi:hypothetical protein [Candidatus Nitrosocosmicus franklandus]|uniref:hypothetical protein n=1 Tax=Candidatus Nitrosocosmicus franklandianus TaxID=1798806 RepID=UPI0018D55BD0|nr:hypothetical protein [Candidatus Nitrosocosmicus franklandus]